MSAERDRWDAAVALQHRAAAALDAHHPGDVAGGRAVVDRLNAAVWELDQAWRALHALGAAPSDAEWAAAYNLHREAMLRAGPREMRWRAEQTLDEQLRDRAAAARLVAAAINCRHGWPLCEHGGCASKCLPCITRGDDELDVHDPGDEDPAAREMWT